MPKIKAIAPAHLAQYRASRKDKKAMSAMTLAKNKCLRCKTVYRDEQYTTRCEQHHKDRREKQQRIYDSLVRSAATGDSAAKRLLKIWKWEE